MDAPKAHDLEVIREPVPVAYEAIWARQQARHQGVAEGRLPDTLYLLEHSAVVTMGKESHDENLLLSPADFAAHGVELVKTSRGGDVTYHGPGQLVAYPILNLNHWKLSVGWYLRSLESVLIDVLADYGLQGSRVEGRTGVWVGDAKVAAIGIALRKWTTLHGIALNVSPNMDHFGYIIPCGIADKPVTSLAQLLDTPPPIDEVADRFEGHFRRHFDCV